MLSWHRSGGNMRSGKLRDIITIQSRTTAKDSFGQPIVTWADFAASIYAKITSVAIREEEAAQSLRNPQRFEIEIRYVAGIDATMRVKFGTRIFNILGVDNLDMRCREMLLTCEEGLSDGS